MSFLYPQNQNNCNPGRQDLQSSLKGHNIFRNGLCTKSLRALKPISDTNSIKIVQISFCNKFRLIFGFFIQKGWFQTFQDNFLRSYGNPKYVFCVLFGQTGISGLGARAWFKHTDIFKKSLFLFHGTYLIMDIFPKNSKLLFFLLQSLFFDYMRENKNRYIVLCSYSSVCIFLATQINFKIKNSY